jgi:hypothetical protein
MAMFVSNPYAARLVPRLSIAGSVDVFGFFRKLGFWDSILVDIRREQLCVLFQQPPVLHQLLRGHRV